MTFGSENSATSPSARHYLWSSATSEALGNTLKLVAAALRRPIAVLHILDEHERYVLAESGAPGLAGTVTDAQRATCLEVMRTRQPLCIEDVHRAEGHIIDSMVDAGAVSYLGYPLFGRELRTIGTLCVADMRPRKHSDADVDLLGKFASIVEEQLELQRQRHGSPVSIRSVRRDAAQGLRDGQIHPWFQPIIDLATGRVVANEALARWHHPQRGVLTPDQFVPSLRDTDLILDLDLAILTEAASAIAPLGQLTLHSNVVVQHLMSTNTLNELIKTIQSCALPPSRVVLEVTELDGGGDPAQAVHALTSLRDFGVRVFLDDVGTGWSTLARLLTWPKQGVKIDWSIASKLGTPQGNSLISGIVAYARTQDVPVVIEGIETAAQARTAIALGCTHAQGFLYAAAASHPSSTL